MSEVWLAEFRVRPDRRSAQASFDDGAAFEMSARLLRAMTPSAQDRGHGGPSFEPVRGLPTAISLTAVSPIGRYALRLGFDDGHDSGLYTWERLRRIGEAARELEARLG